MGTNQPRTNVQLALSCKLSLLKVQHKLRFSIQHVYSHAESVGNEGADHAAALGALGLVSSHDLSTRWARQSFDSVSCFEICHNLGDVLEKLRDIRTARLPSAGPRVSVMSTPCSIVACLACIVVSMVDPRSFAWLNFLWFP